MASGSSDPNIDYVEVSPTILLDSNRYTCEICGKGYPRTQNLKVHQRVHNLPCTLKTRTPNDPVPIKKYLCPESTCAHHNRSHALGDFGGLKKHYLRRHTTDKNYKCDTCSKAYSVHADLKAHAKACATKNYNCRRGSQCSRANYFTAHQENCYARDHAGAVRTMSHPQTSGTRANSNTIIRNEGSNTLNGPKISYIQNQSSSYPFTTSYQSQSYQFGIGSANQSKDKISSYTVNHKDMIIQGDCGNVFGTGEGRQSFFDGGSMHVCSSSSNLTPARHSVSLQEMLNSTANSSVVGSYEQGGYNGYGVGKGPVEYSSETDMLNFQHQHQQQQPPPNMNPQGMNDHGDYGNHSTIQSRKSVFSGGYDHGLNGMFNPMIGSNNMGSYEQGGYKDYGVESGNLGYSGGMEAFKFQQYQRKQPLQIVNPENMNVHGDWSIINGTGDGTKSNLDGGCMLDPSNMTQDVAGSSEQGGYKGPIDAASSNYVSMYEQGGYKGYMQ